MIIILTFGQFRGIRCGDIKNLVTKTAHLFWRDKTFKCQQETIIMGPLAAEWLDGR